VYIGRVPGVVAGQFRRSFMSYTIPALNLHKSCNSLGGEIHASMFLPFETCIYMQKKRTVLYCMVF
jgi:hypothetical protein